MKIYFADAFTDQPFKGNPAAVCFPGSELDSEIMQDIAAEIGFSETAFVRPLADSRFSIRFFTPKKEIPLCGHATLAASKILFATSPVDSILFVNYENTELKIAKAGERVVMRFPVYDTTGIAPPTKMLEALGIDRTVNARYSPKNKIILLEITDQDLLSGLAPDFPALVSSYDGINGVLVTAQSRDPRFDFQYRYFWPWAGTNEDPVTGGVQTFLTKYWATKLNKNKLTAFQSSLRTGTMSTEFLEDHILIYGEAVILLEGNFKL